MEAITNETLVTVPVTVIEDGDEESMQVMASYRHFAEFFLVDADGVPVEQYHILTEEKWLPEAEFRSLINHLRKCGLHWHPDEMLWGVSEGLKETFEYRLYKGLQRIALNYGCPIWVVKVR